MWLYALDCFIIEILQLDILSMPANNLPNSRRSESLSAANNCNQTNISQLSLTTDEAAEDPML